MAVQLGLMGEPNLALIATAAGRARSTIQEWFARYRKGGTELLLAAGLGPGLWRTAPQIQQWLRKEHGTSYHLSQGS